MEKFIGFFAKRKKKMRFISISFLFWISITVIALAGLEDPQGDPEAVSTLVWVIYYVPPVVFFLTGLILRGGGVKGFKAFMLCFILELIASAMPALLCLIELHMLGDYPFSGWLLQAALSFIPFTVSYLFAALLGAFKSGTSKEQA